MNVVFINGNRDGYSIKQCGDTLTVGELKELLEDFNDDTPIYLNNDNGYTYGSIGYADIYDEFINDEKE